MKITTKCMCGKLLVASEKFAGKRAKCPDCGSMVEIPHPELTTIVSPPTESADGHDFNLEFVREATSVDKIPIQEVPKPSDGDENSFYQRRIIGTLFAIGCLIAFQIVLSIMSFPKPVSRPEWEYKITHPHDLLLIEEMDAFGKQGWEMISARRAVAADEKTFNYEMIFKRQAR